MSEGISKLQCIACGTEHEVYTSQFGCQKCGNLLAVNHDLDRLKREKGDLKERFASRLSDMSQPYNSGVWRYHELVLPDIPKEDIVALPEGMTPLYERKKVADFVGAKTVYIKHEGENPTLSFKDRGMTAGVSWANHVKAKRVACASTGDTSAAMAAYAAAANIPGVVLLPHNKISVEQLAQPISYGCRVLALDTDFDGCMSLVKQLTADGEIYLLNSMNPFRIEGQKTIGIETMHQLAWKAPDWMVIPVGNAGNISALGKGLKDLYELGIIDRLPRLAGIQVTKADPFYQSFQGKFESKVTVQAQETVASAIQIGDPVSYDKARAVVDHFNGVVSRVSDDEALEAKALSDSSGVNICPNSGVALAGAKKLASEGVIGANESVVVIATAHGCKFSKAAIDFHQKGKAHSEYANPPEVLSADLSTIKRALS